MTSAAATERPFVGSLEIQGKRWRIVSLARVAKTIAGFDRLPVSLKLLAENVARHEPQLLAAFAHWLAGTAEADLEVPFRPARVLMHDTTCLPALADLAAMRDAMRAQGGDPARVNPLIPVTLVIDHSVAVDRFGTADAAVYNLARDFERNAERYAFVRWGQENLRNFAVVSPGNGICHQINLETLASVVRAETDADGTPMLVPDSLVGTDSHTPTINALGVLAWGVGGIEGQAAALGEPLGLQLPAVVGIRTTGRLKPGVTATDLVLAVTQLLRRVGVVDKFVEFFGDGLDHLSLADRATVANMAPEYGATAAYFPIDAVTIRFLRTTGRSAEQAAIVEAYAKAQGLWRVPGAALQFSQIVELDLAAVETSLAGPSRPHQRVALSGVPSSFATLLAEQGREMPGATRDCTDGAVLIAAITSCTNTANPRLVVQAGLVARRARQLGLRVPPWVRTSLSPGSRAVADYLAEAGLQADLDALGFQVAGFGCMTCIGNSGALDPAIVERVRDGLVGAAVLSGNRNFEGRINPHVQAAYLASPGLVVAYALAGTVARDLRTEPVAWDGAGRPVLLDELWPDDSEVDAIVARVVEPAYARRAAAGIGDDPAWSRIAAASGVTFPWDDASTYIRRPPYFDRVRPAEDEVRGARALLLLGDHVTTDHISPAGAIPADSLAGRYLTSRGVPAAAFDQYSTRRSNHEVLLRGLFTNPRLDNALLPPGARKPGGRTVHQPSGAIMTVYDAAERYRAEGTPLVIFAGREYGAGSSRDWAAKGPALIGVRAVVAESFERIHRKNLVGMGVLPLELPAGVSRTTLGLDGTELFDLARHDAAVTLTIRRADGTAESVALRLRIDTRVEEAYLGAGGILPYVLGRLAAA
ncbi:aconitate hydratase [Aliidongia dinghuensis]|uniref:Aconitate hydratase n=1 Tax=Aliidongia dinghuensis TaxID=1867774 RepID=A0A8J3E5Y7_9PROT|nr:aconitate hydratase AcnA [Aliidongia dinghuensis]GGF39706.1 aconitate hydratase [Aliidongia dinghuensis]